jgi:transcription-repair coupling factor (superfamily II helicase)
MSNRVSGYLVGKPNGMEKSKQHPLTKVVEEVRQSAGFRRKFKKGSPISFEHVVESAQSFVAACVIRQHPTRTCWLICPDTRRQEEICNELPNWAIAAQFFPELELPAIEGAVPDPELVAERLALLQQIATGKRMVLVVTRSVLEGPVVRPDQVLNQTLTLRRSDSLDSGQLMEKLIRAGYEKVSQVSGRGEFANRGGIIDIFSAQHAVPVRVELFGDTIESLREFDLDEQTAIQVVEQSEIFLGDFQGEPIPLRDYVRPGDLVIDIEAEQIDAAVRITAGAFPGDQPEDYSNAFYPSVFHDFEAGDFLVEEHKRQRALTQLEEWLRQDWRLLAVCHNEGEIERLRDILSDNDIDVELVSFGTGSLNHGFVYPGARLAVLCDAEIFGRYQSPSARRLAMRRARLRGGRAPVDFSELAEGDLVVHVEHGIGKYSGIQELEQGGAKSQCVVLEFADDARLYVPFEQAFLISRYVGIGKRFPPLSNLGDAKWSKAKKAAETAVFDYAARLLSLQAQRTTLPGYAFPPDSKWQQEFEGSFLYTETPDQLRAIEETKKDMEAEQPMDRLICGDVGFGKTEVAIRAAFKAVVSGKQAAMLVPTTVLAQQHFETFRQRMSDYPIRVAMLSRFLSVAEQRKTVAAIQDGSIDVIVGTHRLISSDIQFKDLGLVVIDEEQRFGVRHKELLKERFKLIDVLTLSATPIPRTLYLSLVGAKDMSSIETPPPNRLPVETVVCSYDERIIRDAIQRELHRRGQVFFLHNRVHSVERVRSRVQELCPTARVGIGHGQMEEDELEQVMQRFVQGKIDVLITTTIIESGLDIPNANTIIIDRADRFGLADLYQLRGRVGRAQHKAYAYLMLPRDLMAVGAARSRINAIKQYSGLGAGFKIAMRDLEIRGAGNILGTAQSGHIINIGFDLYCQLLQQAVEKLKGKTEVRRSETYLRLDFVVTNESEFVTTQKEQAPAFVPSDYIAQPQTRIEAYKKLAAVASIEQLKRLKAEWRDRFGPLPQAVQNLLMLNEIRLIAGAEKIARIEVKDSKVMLTRGGDYLLIGDRFPRLTSTDPQSSLAELLSLLTRLS